MLKLIFLTGCTCVSYSTHHYVSQAYRSQNALRVVKTIVCDVTDRLCGRRTMCTVIADVSNVTSVTD